MNDQSDTEALLKLLPPFRSTNFTNVAGWKNLLVDAGLDLWSLGQRHGVTLTCLAAMGEAGRLQLSFDRPPPRLSAELEAIKNELAEASGKCCQDCGKPATTTTNGRGEKHTRCLSCLAADRKKTS